MNDLFSFEEFDRGLNESSYASLANTLRGLRPSINAIGIITAWNPNGRQASKEYNTQANKKLARELAKNRLGFKKVTGKYGPIEETFIIPNISETDLYNLGYSFRQDTVIFAQKIEKEDYVGMEFRMIVTNPKRPSELGNVDGVQNVFVQRANAEDFYTEYKGRRFVIPFFGIEDVVDRAGDFEMRKVQVFPEKWRGGEAPASAGFAWYNRQTGKEISQSDYEQAKKLIKESTTAHGYRAWGLRSQASQILRG
jgi:hypothetical protein